MPASVTDVRTYLLAEPGCSARGVPQALSPTDPVPYGATVRLEVAVAADEPLYPLSVGVPTANPGTTLHLYSEDNGTFAGEVTLPFGLQWPSETAFVTGPLRFPGDWPGWGGGEYTFQLRPWPQSVGAEGELLPTTDHTVTLADPPVPSGAAPRIVSLSANLPDNRVRRGQPWRPTVTVADDDNDVVAVTFCVYVAGVARWWYMFDDGRHGDAVAGDGVYSFLRVGNDWFDRPETGWAQDLTATFCVQALDAQGNWSEPASFDYTIVNSEPPVWEGEPHPAGPNITAAGASKDNAPPACFRLSASCDAEAWVVARQIGPPDQYFPLLDDAYPPGATAGDRQHHELFWQPYAGGLRRTDLVCYGVPKAGPHQIGQKMALHCPAHQSIT